MTFVIGTPHTHNAGYYRSDNRVSGGKLRQADIQTCWHCQAIVKLNEWKEDGGFCRGCMKPVCNLCADEMLVYGCVPFMKKLETAMNLGEKYRQYIKLAGLEPPAPPQPIITGV